MGKEIINLTGQKFGALTAVEFLGRKNKHSIFRCACECGGETITTSNNLRRGHTKSCGCLSIKTVIDRSVTHGLSNHPLYSIWCGMKNRCYYEGHNRHQLYVDKNVYVCDEWLTDYTKFHNWALENGWKRGLTVDRRNNYGPYSPDNCRIATQKVQSRNKSNNVNITYNGETKILIEWSEHLGISYGKIQTRYKRGWPIEEVLFGRKLK